MGSALFSPITLRGLTLPNRVVVSPMCQYNSDHGSVTDWHLMHLGQFSLGAAGLVMTESTHVNFVGRITLKCAALCSDEIYAPKTMPCHPKMRPQVFPRRKTP